MDTKQTMRFKGAFITLDKNKQIHSTEQDKNFV